MFNDVERRKGNMKTNELEKEIAIFVIIIVPFHYLSSILYTRLILYLNNILDKLIF